MSRGAIDYLAEAERAAGAISFGITERIEMDAMLFAGDSASQIAQALHVPGRTVVRRRIELRKRGYPAQPAERDEREWTAAQRAAVRPPPRRARRGTP